MTARVEKNPVFERIPSSFEQGDDKVQSPAGLTGDGLLAFWAEPVLMPPQVGQFLSPFFAFTRELPPSFFEIGLPSGIEGIGVPLDLGVSDDFRVARSQRASHRRHPWCSCTRRSIVGRFCTGSICP